MQYRTDTARRDPHLCGDGALCHTGAPESEYLSAARLLHRAPRRGALLALFTQDGMLIPYLLPRGALGPMLLF